MHMCFCGKITSTFGISPRVLDLEVELLLACWRTVILISIVTVQVYSPTHTNTCFSYPSFIVLLIFTILPGVRLRRGSEISLFITSIKTSRNNYCFKKERYELCLLSRIMFLSNKLNWHYKISWHGMRINIILTVSDFIDCYENQNH